MKIRNGFVSNSSSSSFVVALPKQPKNVKELKEMLFGDEKYYEYCDGKIFKTERVAETVFDDIQDFIKSNSGSKINYMLESLINGWFNGHPDLEKYKIEDPQSKSNYIYDWNRYHLDCKKIAKKVVQKFKKENKGRFIFVVDYSDNSGDYFCALEHGPLFDDLPHIRTSYH